MTLHFLNDVVKIEIYAILASLKSEKTCKLINSTPGSDFWMSSLPGSALRMLVEALLVNLISKATHLIFSIYLSGRGCKTVGIRTLAIALYKMESQTPTRVTSTLQSRIDLMWFGIPCQK